MKATARKEHLGQRVGNEFQEAEKQCSTVQDREPYAPIVTDVQAGRPNRPRMMLLSAFVVEEIEIEPVSSPRSAPKKGTADTAERHVNFCHAVHLLFTCKSDWAKNDEAVEGRPKPIKARQIPRPADADVHRELDDKLDPHMVVELEKNAVEFCIQPGN